MRIGWIIALATLALLLVLWLRSEDGAGVAPSVAAVEQSTDGAEGPFMERLPDLEATKPLSIVEEERRAIIGDSVPAAAETRPRLRVRVVDEQGTAILSGEIYCHWGRAPNNRLGLHRTSVPIAGPVTGVALPEDAGRVLVEASARGHSPSRRVDVWVPRDLPYDLLVTVGSRVAPPSVEGAIIVDGTQRIPRGLTVVLDATDEAGLSSDILALFNTVDATYAAGPLGGGRDVLWVTSDETAPATFVLPRIEGERRLRLDLELTGGRRLEVEAVDHATGAAAPRVKLACRIQVVSERTLTTVLSRSHTLSAVTDELGRCTFAGIPEEGELVLLEVEEKRELVRRRLSPDGPEVLRETVVVHMPRPETARVWIQAPSDLGVEGDYRVRRRETTDDARTPVLHANLQSGGRWFFDAVVPTSWEVWAEREGVSITERATVHVTDSREVGPVSLVATVTQGVTLRVINLPPNGWLNVYVYPSGQRISERVDGGEFEYTLVMSGKNAVQAAYSVERRDKSSVVRVVEVDPNEQTDVVIDFEGSVLRTFEMTLNGAAPEGEGGLVLLSLDGDRAIPLSSSMYLLEDGTSEGALPVPPGRYLYIMVMQPLNDAVLGVVDVPVSRLVRIAWVGRSLSAAELGKEIEFESVDGVSLKHLDARWRRVRWSDDGPTTRLVPEQAEYVVVE